MTNGPAATETRHLRTLFALGAAGALTDGQLLERFATLRGDPAELAFAALVERHGPMVLRVARSALVDEHSAHDAFQATFLILARKARSLWVRDSLGPWLHAVAYRVASQSRAAEARRRMMENEAARPEAHQPRDRDRSDLARAIHQEIERLPAPYRLAVMTCHLEGLTQHEAAARLGWPVGTLQSRLARGRQRLRDRLRRRGLAPSLGALIGKAAPMPNALTASTARGAMAITLGPKAAGVIAPAVLAMIETSTKGMLMTKLKLGAAALLVALGLFGSGMDLGLGRAVQATDDRDQAKVADAGRAGSPRKTGPISHPSETIQDADGDGRPDVLTIQGDEDAPVAPPADGPGFPYLLEFYETQSVGGLKNHQGVTSLLGLGYPIKSFDVAIYGDGKSPGRPTAGRYEVNGYPTIVLVDGKGDEIDRLARIATPAEIAEFYNTNRSRSPNFARHVNPAFGSQPLGVEPGLTIATPPRPWETVVRIKLIAANGAAGFTSGVVIGRRKDEAIILTAAEPFQVLELPGLYKGQKSILGEPKGRIEVHLFDGKLDRTAKNANKLVSSRSTNAARLLGYDVVADLAVLSIRTDQDLPAAHLVPPGWKPLAGTRMYAAGCSDGNDPTTWDTTILDPDARFAPARMYKGEDPGDPDRPAVVHRYLKCAHEPKDGRSGGGLSTTDGYLAGICSLIDGRGRAGLYVPPSEIRRFLGNQGLDEFLDATLSEQPRNEDAPKTPDGVEARTKAMTPADEAAPSASTDRQRLDELERKLDRVLKALDALKPGKATETPEIVSPPGN